VGAFSAPRAERGREKDSCPHYYENKNK